MNIPLSLMVVFLTTVGAPARPDSPADPVEGKWLGTAGTPLDRVPIGLEVKRGDKGELKAFLYSPVVNFYGLELPGALTRNGDNYVLASYGMTFTLQNGKIDGSYLRPKRPLSLERTETLPSEAPVPDLPKGPGPKWQTKLGGAIYAPAAARDGIAYVGTTGGIFNAINIRDGGFVWTFVTGRPIHGEALLTDEHVYFVCDNGYLFKLDRKTGKEVWRYDLEDERVARPLGHPVLANLKIGKFDFDHTAPRPLLVEGIIYVGSGTGRFHAVEAASGKRIWCFEGKGKIRTNAVLAGSRVIFGTFTGFVYAVDAQTGKQAWRQDTFAEVTSSPALINDKLIVGNRGGLLAALDPATGSIAWRVALWGSSVESTAVPGDGSLFYIGSSDLRRLSLIDSTDGRVLWRTDVFGIPWARPAVAEKLVYVSAAGCNPYQMRHLGSFSAVDRKSGKILWRWPTPESTSLYSGFVAAPVVEADTVVVGGLDGTLYGFPAK